MITYTAFNEMKQLTAGEQILACRPDAFGGRR